MTEKRNYLAEMDTLVDRYCPADTSGWVASIQAAKIVAHLRENDKALLTGWLLARAEQVLTSYIAYLVRMRREGRDNRAEQFAEKVRAYEMQHACAGNIRKVASEMTAEDHRFVASRHKRLSQTHAFLDRFHRAVADAIGDDKKTSEVLTADEYDMMYDSIMHPEKRPVAEEETVTA
jgi:hypothetical protein